jgi:hypothetical protein
VADAHRDKYANDFKMAEAWTPPQRIIGRRGISTAAKPFAEMDIFQWMA